MGWRYIMGLVLLGLLAACAAPTPPSLPQVAGGVRLGRDFPPGAEPREHLALRQPLGNRGRPGEQQATFYQFADHPFNIGPGWCSTTPQQTAQNWSQMEWSLKVDGVEVPLTDYTLTDSERVTGVCRLWLVVITGMTPGPHDLVYTLKLNNTIGDGTYRYAAGEYITRIRVVGVQRQPSVPRPPLIPTLSAGSSSS